MGNINKINLLRSQKDKLNNDVHYMILEESTNDLDDKSVVVRELQESGVSDNTTLIKDSAFVDALHRIKTGDENEIQDDFDKLPLTSKKQEILEQSNIPFTKEKDPFEILPSDHNLISQLLAYVDVYAQAGMLNRGFKLVLSKKSRLNTSKISTTAVYNLLMKAYASKSQLGRVSEIYDVMNENCVKLDAETFALMFQMIGHMKSQAKLTEMVAKLVEDMGRYDVSFDDIINVSQTKATNRDAVLRCIRLASPEYDATYTNFDKMYNCKLLRNLKASSSYHSPAEGVVTLDEIRQTVQAQVDIEMQQELEVNSIAGFTGDVSVRQQAVSSSL